MKTTFTNEISEHMTELTELQHTTYEDAHEIVCAYTPFYCLAQEGEILMGITSGYTCYAEVYIDDILVFTPYRNKGVGRKLLKAVEEHFSNGLFNNINLVTNEFQAPAFYEKCGFTLEFVRHNRQNSLLNKYFFVKYF